MPALNEQVYLLAKPHWQVNPSDQVYLIRFTGEVFPDYEYVCQIAHRLAYCWSLVGLCIVRRSRWSLYACGHVTCSFVLIVVIW